jgi:hypothetical protein
MIQYKFTLNRAYSEMFLSNIAVIAIQNFWLKNSNKLERSLDLIMMIVDFKKNSINMIKYLTEKVR